MNEILYKLISWDKEITLAVNSVHTQWLDGVMSSLTSKSVWIPISVVILYTIFRNTEWRRFLLISVLLVLCVTFADQISSSVFKPLFHRLRPTHDPDLMHLVSIVDGYRGGKYGFISSHAANCTSIAVFLSFLFRNRKMSIVLAVWAFCLCYTRIYMGVHFLGDLLVGAFVGALIGWGMSCLYRYALVHCRWVNNGIPNLLCREQYKHLWLIYAALSATYLFVFVKAFWM